MATREKNIWILLLFILSGIVVGGLLGNLASHVDFCHGYLMVKSSDSQIQ